MDLENTHNIALSESERSVLARINESEAVGLLQNLVRVDTVNPPGIVDLAVRHCGEVLSRAGFVCRTVQLETGKPNLIAVLGSGDGPTLCLNAHLDVVPVGDLASWQSSPFGAEIRGRRVYGRGALDDKASVVAQVMAGVAIAGSGLELAGTLIINAVADEEIGGPAGTALIVDGRHIVPDFVIVGEPTSNQICVGERGGGLIKIEVRGRTAHGALPWEGANAIEGMALVIASLRSELWPKLQQRTHPYFHHSSASVNVIEGGVKDNVIPDLCVASIDRRYILGDDPDTCLVEFAEVAQRAVEGLEGVSVEVYYSGEVNRARMTEPDSPLVRSMQAANKKLGLSTELTGFSMATDGRFFAAAGYPTIIYGPGDPKLAHLPNESIGIDVLLDATRAYALATLQILGRR